MNGCDNGDLWREERRQALAEARCVVVKVGSAVLSSGTDLELGVLDNLVEQLVTLQGRGNAAPGQHHDTAHPRRVILVSSGAVAAGRTALGVRGQCVADLAGKQAAAAVGQGRLMHLYDQAFTKRHTLTAQVLLTRDDLKDRQRFLNIRNTFASLLDWNVIPVVNENDTVSVNELKFSDNDNLASLLLNTVEADLFINLTTIGGVLDANPQLNPQAQIMPCIQRVRDLDLDSLCGGKTSVGTGGMYSKLLSATRAAQLGVPTLILPGKLPDVITRAMALAAQPPASSSISSCISSPSFSTSSFNPQSCDLGTWVRPEAHTVSRRKYWLAYQAEPQGTLLVDAGAADALLRHGKSLLPGGIVHVDGIFEAGTLVRITHEGANLGVGLSNYDAQDLCRIKGLKRHEVAAILGDAHYPEVIHRDNMLMDAAL